MEFVVVGIGWILWCSLHSLLIADSVTHRLQRYAGRTWRFYRLAYNAFSVASLAIIVRFSLSLSSPTVWTWHGWLQAPRLALLLTSLVLFAAAARRYDLLNFLGIDQLKGGRSHRTLAAGGALDTGGVLGRVRHPWYAAGILFIWSYRADIDATALIAHSVLTVYLVIGARLEERKLEREFGNEYRRYRERVPMLIPRLTRL